MSGFEQIKAVLGTDEVSPDGIEQIRNSLMSAIDSIQQSTHLISVGVDRLFGPTPKSPSPPIGGSPNEKPSVSSLLQHLQDACNQLRSELARIREVKI